jgi:citronellol/citronellal dehydrogenase
MQTKRFDLIHAINVRGTFLTARACIPFLRGAANPHILTLSPPLDLNPAWFADHLGYTLSKYGMSMCTLGLAQELKPEGIACNALWPRTTIATAAVEFALGGESMLRRSRTPEIVADAAYAIMQKRSREFTGNFLIDEDFLRTEGVEDFSRYSHSTGELLQTDLFVREQTGGPV